MPHSRINETPQERPMTRFKTLTLEEMPPEQRSVAERAASGPRAKIGPPLNVLLRSPGAADPIEHLGTYVRFKSTLPQRLKELVIIIIARRFTSQYPWSVHYPLALAEGIALSVVEDIAAGRQPSELKADEAVIYEYCTALLDGRDVADANYADVIKRWGETGAIDIIALMGYYCLLGMGLNLDRYPPVPGAAPALKPLP
jgi:4-carboxymuconolactone decarboxylase